MTMLSRHVRAAAAVVAVLATTALTSAYASAATIPGPSGVASPQLVALEGSVIQAQSSPVGAYRSPQMSVEVTLAPRDAGALNAELRAAYTPGTAGYHQWLTPGQFDARYEPTTAERDAVEGYLRSAGLKVVGSATPFLVRAIGSSQQVQAAFDTPLSSYRAGHGVRYFANSAAVRLPAGIARDVLGVVGLASTVRTRPMLQVPAATSLPRQAGSAGQGGYASCEAGYPTASDLFLQEAETTSFFLPTGYGDAPDCSGLTPSQVNSIYDAPHASPRTQGAGVTLAVFELSAYQPSDVDTWARAVYGPDYHPMLKNINVDGGPLTPVCPKGDQCPADINGYYGDGEVVADIETDLTIAPDARSIEVYNAPDDVTGQTYLDEYAAIANQDSAAVVSASWANCENFLSTGFVQAENEIFEQMALQGQSMFSGAGDSGAFGCVASNFTYVQNVMDPASQPWVTGVGGTSLEGYNPGPNPDPGPPPRGVETVWNPDNLCGTQAPAASNDGLGGLFWCAFSGAGGGGYSQYWARPFYQHGPGVNNPAYPNASGRKNSSGIADCALARVGTPCREVPDVSALADGNTGYAEYCTGNASLPNSICAQFDPFENVPGWFEIGGTSLSGPLWAGIAADRDSYLGRRVGNINPWIYQLLDTDPARYFTDITGIGPKQQRATTNGIFPTTPGYDMATGVGTPKMAALITAPM
jgi:subtilase family serine protease